MAKTIRFGDLVRVSGRPEPVTLWTDPKRDRSFTKAVHENRVITIHSDPASHKKDYGQIGFHEEKGATYLVFPRALPKDPRSRIVGINYQLAEDGEVKGPLAREEPAPKTRPKAKPKAAEPAAAVEREVPAQPKTRKFQVIVRRTATLEEMQQVNAPTGTQARELALKQIKHKRFSLNRAIMREDVVSIAEER